MLAHPLRWQVVKTLSTSDRRVQELVDALQQPYNLVSYHLKLLRESKLVVLRKSDADNRDLYYSLNIERLQEDYQDVAYAIHPGWVWKEAAQLPVRPIPRRVLFLCTHNSARSQMAEGLLRQVGGNNYLVSSAGTLPQKVHPETIAVMKELGVDISHQRSKHISELRDQSFDEVITVCDRVREVCPNYDFCMPTIHWSIPDPASIQDPAERLNAFTSTAHELQRRIRHFMFFSQLS
jgi:protein-tyrosine-phosphatase/DNA-binding transcriptional ArsR family regulator